MENKIIGVLSIGAPIRKGPKGDRGEQGPAGPTGPAGKEGPIGPQGLTGEQGPEGKPGAMGPAGPKGERGPRGEIGPAGPEGKRGKQGFTGPAGPAGNRGLTGPEGPKGDIGPQGIRGEKGQKGDTGEKGATGEQGPRGIPGERGPIGEMGPAGPAGPTGETGPVGERGPAGPMGPRGPKGDGVGIEDDKVKNNKVWSSKQVNDFILEDKGVIWQDKEGSSLKVDNTTNGYIRNMIVEGKTVKDDRGAQGVGRKSKNLFNAYDEPITLKKGIYFISSAYTKGAKRFKITGAREDDLIFPKKYLYWHSEGIYIKANDEEQISTQMEVVNPCTIAIGERSNGVPYKDIQLEEGDKATSYEPYYEGYKINVKTENKDKTIKDSNDFIIPRQLMQGEKLTYDSSKKKYIIIKQDGQEETDIIEEILPKTYNNTTYINIDSGVSGNIKGQYPTITPPEIATIKDYYTKIESDERYQQIQQELSKMILKYERLLMTLGLEDEEQEIGQTLEETEHKTFGEILEGYIPNNAIDTIKNKYGVDK